LPDFSKRSFANFSRVYENFYRAYEQYRVELAEWEAKYGTPGAPKPSLGTN
jgi:hypothetical protein